MLTIQSSVYCLLLLYSETAHRDLGRSNGLEIGLLLILSCLGETENQSVSQSVSQSISEFLYLLQELPVFLLLLQARQTRESVLQPLLCVLQLFPQPIIFILY